MQLSLLSTIADRWRAPSPPKCRDWVPANTIIPDTTESPGEFDLDLFPHVAEVLEAVDDPDVRLILMDWATRNAKTFTTLSIGQYFARCWRAPMVFASSDEVKADETIEEKFVPLLRACREPGVIRTHTKKGVFIDDYRIRKAFAGSPGSLAGYPAKVGLGNEIGLWPINMVRRLIQRGKLFAFDSKYVLEGKPETEGKCAITSLIAAKTTQRRYRFVKCPHCGKYQRLKWGWGRPGPGVKWIEKENAIATAETAYYECVDGCRIEDIHRVALLRNGKWIPEGCTIDSRGRIRGRPAVPTRNVAFCGLSSLYSLAISGWGQIVQEWFECQDDPEAKREFITGTLAETYNPRPKRAKASEIAEAMRAEDHQQRGVCPEWACFLTTSADVGVVGDLLLFYWMVCGWGITENRDPRGGVIDWGFSRGTDGEGGFLKQLGQLSFEHDDGGEPMSPLDHGFLGAVDSGDETTQVYDLVRPLPNWYPAKGDSRKTASVDWYSWGTKLAGELEAVRKLKKKLGVGDLFTISTIRTQVWRRSLVRGRIRYGKPNFVSLPAEVCDDWRQYENFLMQLDADVEDDGKWVKEGMNEYGDTLRYCRALAELHTRGGSAWKNLKRVTSKPHRPPARRSQNRRRRGSNFATGAGGR